MQFATANIDKFEDSLTRSIIIASAWDMVRDAQMPARTFIDLVMAALPVEQDITVMGLWLRQLDTAAAYYTSNEERREVLEHVADRLLLLLRAASSG